MLRIALGQMEIIPGRPDINSRAMLAMIEEARAGAAHMVVFPEMAIPGYLLGDTWEQQAFLRDCEEYGRRIVAASAGLCVVFGNVGLDWNRTGDDGRVRKYNAFFVAQNGRLWAGDHFPYPFRIKTLLPNYREFDDTRHFYSLRKLAADLGRDIGELLQPVCVEVGGRPLRIGSLICEDGWYDDYSLNPVAEIAAKGPVDLLINISSSPFTLGKQGKRHRVFGKSARETGAPLVYVNNVGVQNNGKTVYTFDGASTVYNRRGQIVASCPAFEPSLRFLDLALSGGDSQEAALPPEDQSMATIYQALSYGAANFLKQIGMERVVIGASGGIDSAVSAALYASILGPENVLLANLPSVYNSATTKSLADDLAKRLGCLYTVVPIQESVDHTIRQLNGAPVVNRATGGQSNLSVTPFITENIQARDRSARVLAGLAAAFGGGFTCNANKSETTVGYSTLYGDQAGFLAVLADLWKHQVYALGRHLNEQVFHSEIIPQGVFTLTPSAELSTEQNVDEGKGDPLIYPYHDYLFRSFMEWWNRATPEDLLGWYASGELEAKLGCEPGLVSKLFPGPAHFIADLEKWWKLYSGMGVAKRIQAPPVLAVSRRAYGFDHREAQNSPYFTARYCDLKERLLAANR
ncbi:MAG TPA: NAD(+) synthase [Selenomonadales bacterium]|nr:NAD(+) synthase [Selenomonadales bacterium]